MRFFPAQSTKAYRRPRGGQSGREKKGDKSFQAPFLPARSTDRPWVSENANTVSLNTQLKAVCNEV